MPQLECRSNLVGTSPAASYFHIVTCNVPQTKSAHQLHHRALETLLVAIPRGDWPVVAFVEIPTGLQPPVQTPFTPAPVRDRARESEREKSLDFPDPFPGDPGNPAALSLQAHTPFLKRATP